MPLPLIVSFYTPNWKYPEYAQALRDTCHRLDLECCIEQRQSYDDYRQNCNIKPGYILECLERFKRPVLWIDADSTLVELPLEMAKGFENWDIIGISKESDHRQLYVNALLFNYTPKVIDFVGTWNAESQKSIDDGAFQKTITAYNQEIKILKLPSSFNQIILNHKTIVSPDAFFLTRLSASDLKLSYKKKVERK